MQSLKCGQCGSPDIEFLPGGFGRCRNCKTTYAPQAAHPAPMPPVPMPPGHGPQPFPQSPQPSSMAYPPARPANAAGCIIGLLVVFGLMAVGAAYFLFVGSRPTFMGPEDAPTPRISPSTKPAGASNQPATVQVKDIPAPKAKRTEAELRDVRSATPHGILVYVARYMNTGETPIVRPSAVLSLFDASGKRVAEQAGYAHVEWLAPGQWCAVSCTIAKPPEYARAELKIAKPRAPEYETQPLPMVLVEWGVDNNGFGTDRVTGTLRNETGKAVRFARIVVTGLDSAGLPVSDSYAFASEDEIAPGAESGFQVLVTSLKVGEPVRYQVQSCAMAK